MLEKDLREELKNTGEAPVKRKPDRELDVFISYSSLNKNVADAVVSDFEQHGIRCWYAPRDILPGREWVTAIHDAIAACRLFILIYTDSSNESRQVANEVALAFNHGKTLIPFRLTEAQMSTELEYYLTRVHWLDAVTPPLKESIENLRNYSAGILSGAEGAKASAVAAGKDGSRRRSVTGWVICALLSVICIAAIILLLSDRGGDRPDAEDETASAVAEETENSTSPASHPALFGAASPSQPSQSSAPGASDYFDRAYSIQMENGGEKSLLIAYEYYMKTGDAPAEDKAVAQAVYELGNRFCNGEGVPQDYKKGMDLYNKAIISGNTSAMNMMGNLYLRGDGVDEDLEKAREYYQMAADLGDETALKNLEYLDGLS